MTDSYIDADETQIYGPYAVAKIKEHVVGIIADFDKSLKYVAGELEDATQAVAQTVEEARSTDAERREGTQAKKPALAAARELLGRFSRHIDSHPANAVDRKVFFTGDGTAVGVGRSAPKVLLAVNRIAQRLGARGSGIREAGTWRTEMLEAAAALAPAVAHSDAAKTARAGLTPEVEAARAAWLTSYAAAKLTVEAVLRLTGQAGSMSTIFYDLAVPAGSKVVAPPGDGGVQPGVTPPAPPAPPVAPGSETPRS